MNTGNNDFIYAYRAKYQSAYRLQNLTESVKKYAAIFYKRFYNFFSRAADMAISSLSLLILAPVYILIGVLVKLDSKGPVFYTQRRVGQNRRCADTAVFPAEKESRKIDLTGRIFTIYKIRTMRHDAECGTGAVWAKQHDSRVTSLGRFLRLTRLDETPQFLNVLKNDMTIIGPRPERPEFVLELANKIKGFGKRHIIKPGITGLAQVKYKYTASLTDARRKIKYDLLYLKKRSIKTDIFILLNTLPTVIFGKGAR